MANIKDIAQGTVYQKKGKYQWPANKLTDQEMSILHSWRKRTGTPINHLLQQAIVEMNRIIGRRY